MRICVFTRTTLVHSMGGMEVHLDLLTKGLAKHGHSVAVITTGHPRQVLEDVSAGVKTYYLDGTIPGKYSRAWDRQAEKKLRALHEQEPFDAVLSESAGAFYLLRVRLNKKLRLPVILIMHGIFYNELKTRINMGLSLRGVLAIAYYIASYLFRDLVCFPRADAVIATSVEQKYLIGKFFFLPENKIFTVFNGIDTNLSAPDNDLKKKLGITPEQKIVLCIARLKREKGLHVTLAAVPEILKYQPQARLLIVGDGEYRPALDSLAAGLGITDKIKFAGMVPFVEIGKYFHLADVFVNSTIRENGYDLTIIQAMAYAKPVVVSSLKSLKGVIEPGDNGFLVPRGQAHELAQAVVMVLDNQKLSAIVGERAQAKARKYFSVETMITETEKVLRQCLSTK
jgi:glycosyltransferase involved in cell wall biosynthesis